MKYYRARRDAYDYFNKYGVIEDELLTEKERNIKCPYIADFNFEPVEIPKNNTCFIFGCRFAKKD